MKKMFVKNVWTYLFMILTLSSCKEDGVELHGTRDLEDLSVLELKKILDGTWRLHRSEIGTIAGMEIHEIPEHFCLPRIPPGHESKQMCQFLHIRKNL